MHSVVFGVLGVPSLSLVPCRRYRCDATDLAGTNDNCACCVRLNLEDLVPGQWDALGKLVDVGYTPVLGAFFMMLGGCLVTDAPRIGTDELTDELSMPAEPTLAVDSFNSATVCGSCHPQHYAEWRTSMHAYAMVDPVFRKLLRFLSRVLPASRATRCRQFGVCPIAGMNSIPMARYGAQSEIRSRARSTGRSILH